MQRKHVIEDWIRLYNRLTGACYRVTSLCVNSRHANVDAVCTDLRGALLAIEHILVAPLQKQKTSVTCVTIRPNSRGTSQLRSDLERKLLKRAVPEAGKRILLLESNSVTGTIEDQYASAHGGDGVSHLLNGADEIWAVYTAVLASDNLIFMNRIYPAEDDDRSLCSLNVITGEFWQLVEEPPTMVDPK
jgi:hypothetical protein